MRYMIISRHCGTFITKAALCNLSNRVVVFMGRVTFPAETRRNQSYVLKCNDISATFPYWPNYRALNASSRPNSQLRFVAPVIELRFNKQHFHAN